MVAPVLLGALISGAALLYSSTSSNRLAEDVARESKASVTLFRDLQAARLAGSSYMEGGAAEDREDFNAAATLVNRGLANPVFEAGYQRAALRRVSDEWRAAVKQLRGTETGISSSRDDAEDPEDVFEDHVNAAIQGVERMVELAELAIQEDLDATRGVQRTQAAVALVALLISIAIAVLLVGRLAGGLVRPIHRLTRAARAFGSGHLGHRVAVDSSAELHEMADTFNRMAGALQEQHEQLEQQAFTDSLTGIPNRALFEDRARHALDRSAGTSERVAALVIDLDEFKLVNDGLGHTVGDQLLKEAAQRMLAVLRPSDTIARLGGDEFAVLLESVRGLDDALGAAERVLRAFDEPFRLKGSDLVVTASVGIAMSTDGINAGELLRRADLAMYRVKGRGKNGTAFFDAGMEDRASDRLEILSALRRATAAGELVAHYQPVIDLETGEVVGAEALMRWDRPEHGLVPPLEFIPLAEETGLIQPLGAWILKEACTRACEWAHQGAPDVRVAVNVSARQLIEPHFEEMVLGTLAETGLDPGGLVLEVTESSVIQNADVTIAKLDRLTQAGVGLFLDDFGEGYSSLSHLRRLPVTGLKIARPFIQDVVPDPAMVRGIIELANSLGLELVAEGIETPEQHDILRVLGCSLGQGFLFARPVALPAFRELLSAQATVQLAASRLAQ